MLGYSLNALITNDSYATIHVTPEKDYSYASFETNADLELDTGDVLKKVLSTFQPKRFTGKKEFIYLYVYINCLYYIVTLFSRISLLAKIAKEAEKTKCYKIIGEVQVSAVFLFVCNKSSFNKTLGKLKE